MRCPKGCGEMIERQRLSSHLKDICGKREIECRLCHVMCWADELEEHQRFSCSEREVVCKCGLSFTAKDQEAHFKTDCDNRILLCSCGVSVSYFWIQKQVQVEQVQASLMRDHALTSCELEEDYCTAGCGVKVIRKDMNNHLQIECKKQFESVSSFVSCKWNCGLLFSHQTNPKNRILLAEMKENHEEKECP